MIILLVKQTSLFQALHCRQKQVGFDRQIEHTIDCASTKVSRSAGAAYCSSASSSDERNRQSVKTSAIVGSLVRVVAGTVVSKISRKPSVLPRTTGHANNLHRGFKQVLAKAGINCRINFRAVKSPLAPKIMTCVDELQLSTQKASLIQRPGFAATVLILVRRPWRLNVKPTALLIDKSKRLPKW